MLGKIVNHLKSKWYRYIIEIIVVIVGILIAFNLEQWSDTRNSKKKEIELLKDFKENLTADLETMHFNMWFHKTSIQCSKTILQVIKDDLPYNDSLDVYFSFTHAFSSFAGRLGPIEQLKNSNLTAVSNDSLRLKIIYMYDQVFPVLGLVEIAVKRDYEQLRDFDRLYFDTYDFDGTSKSKSIPTPPWGTMRPLRFAELKTNPEYAALLRARISNQMGITRLHYNHAEKDLIKLIDQIDLELTRLVQQY
jgi:hypothetical protein